MRWGLNRASQRVVPEPDEGACFYFTVPVWDGQGAS